MDLNVLVEAKKEYLNQLCSLMCPFIIDAFHDMYKESEKMSKNRRVLLQYQQLLKDVPNWNDSIIKSHSDKLSNSCSWFSDLLAAVFVSFVKILSSVRLKTENKKISIKLPSNEIFVHAVYVNAAKDLYKDPYIYHDELSEYDRDNKLTIRFIAVIDTTIRELIPIQQILKTYMSQENSTAHIDINEDTEDTEDPEIDDELEPEPEPEPPGTVDVPVPELEPELESAPEIKQIPVTCPIEDESLFDDAIEEKETLPK